MIDQTFLSNLLAWSLQAGLLVIVAAAVLSCLRVTAPAIRHAWWRVVLAACLLLPFVQPWRAAPIVPVDDVAFESAPASATSGAGSGAAAVRTAPVDMPRATGQWPAAVLLVLAAGAATRFAWLGAGLLRLRRLRGAGERAEPSDGHVELQKLTEAGAEIRYVKVLGQPVTFGLRRPVVLLPESLRALPDGVQRAVLAHELWHVKRRDWGWILAEESVRAVLWFHPAIWFLVSRVQSSREEVVDELTVLLTNSRPQLPRGAAGVCRRAAAVRGGAVRQAPSSVQANAADFEGGCNVVETNHRIGCRDGGGCAPDRHVWRVCVSADLAVGFGLAGR